MATISNVKCISLQAASDLSLKRYYLAKLDSSGNAVLAAAGTDKVHGPIMEPAASGLAVSVAISGEPKCIAGGTIAVNDYLASDANGKAVATTTGGDFVFGKALEAAAAGDVFQYEKLDFKF